MVLFSLGSFIKSHVIIHRLFIQSSICTCLSMTMYDKGTAPNLSAPREQPQIFWYESIHIDLSMHLSLVAYSKKKCHMTQTCMGTCVHAYLFCICRKTSIAKIYALCELCAKTITRTHKTMFHINIYLETKTSIMSLFLFQCSLFKKNHYAELLIWATL